MFPLGMVLFPGQVLPLRVFEPRYRQMIEECLRDDVGFGVTLIERGSEVGGGDVRTALGTVARLVQAVPHPGGRWSVVAVGIERIRVREWLVDDPYPCAEIEAYPDLADAEPLDAAIGQASDLMRQVLALKAEVGERVGSATFELSANPLSASYQLAAMSPFGPFDKLNLLDAPRPGVRLGRLVTLLSDELAFCEAQMRLDAGTERDE
jgi:uncharacterized protein